MTHLRFFIIFATLLQTSISFTPAQFKHQFDTALRHHRQGNYETSIEAYKFLLKQRPKSISILSNYASALQSIHQNEQAIHLYKKAIQYNPTHVRLRINLGTALQEIDPQGSLNELSIAHNILSNQPKPDPQTYSNVLSNMAAIASTTQLWKRDKIEKYYLASLAIYPTSIEANQNLLLFQQQEKEATARSRHLSMEEDEAKPTCCNAKMQKNICVALGELLKHMHSTQVIDKHRLSTCGQDDFCNPIITDVEIAKRLACGTEDDTQDETQDETQDGSVTKHVRQFLDCHICSNSREGRLLDHLSQLTVDSVQDVLNGIDSFTFWHMSLGFEKCNILKEAVEASSFVSKKKHHLELGGYIGYSALCVASMPSVALVTSIETNPIFVAVARYIVDMAELTHSSVVFVLGGIQSLSRSSNVLYGSVLLDHWKDEYLKTLQLLEMENVLALGVVVVADNVVSPGVPQIYLDYVRNEVYWKSRAVTTQVEHLDGFEIKDAMEISTRVRKRNGRDTMKEL